ncbi:Prefoldin subunit 6 [Zalaria obscura]|uniref:Prefoldin subunit 6 n=1 Tax=Zalaria obscura TaxID=2024903 RepID=A0ACC3SQA3_9PEZI
MATPEQQKQLQALSDEYTNLQTELQTTIAARQKLESQQQENKSVQKEFSTLSEDANIYKLVGPVLLKQDTTEAKSTVEGRLDFIEKEIKRIEKQITDIQQKSEEKKMEVFQLQTQIQQSQPEAQAA